MSLFSSMRTSVSGMAAQSNALSAVSDNIANASTTGYKRASAEFETLMSPNVTSEYMSGGVLTDMRYSVTQQGTVVSTSSATDLAIKGNGFFVVSKGGGDGSFLTRAGSFIPDSSGNLVNTAGYQLMGYQVTASGIGSNLVPVQVSATDLKAAATTAGTLTANLPSAAAASTGALPSSNAAGATYTSKTSLTVYDNLGTKTVLDVYVTKTGANAWEATAYLQNAAAAGGGFPYASGPVGTTNLTFDPTTGKLAAASPTSMTATVPNGNPVAVDLSGMTQLATDFSVTVAKADGNSPSRLDTVKVSADGTLTVVYASGIQVPTYKIPLATVASPDNLTPLSGNIYAVSAESGTMVLNDANSAGTGSIVSSALEQSTVDLATELTNMIQAQRGYEANSKVLQTSADLLSVLNRLNIS